MKDFSIQSSIVVRGARTHNLRNVDVDLPHGRLIVITGVSGSGKSSLAFDTIFAEGQRRYLDSVSAHTRSIVSQLPRPDVDEILNLPPTVCLDQRTSQAPARSTLSVTTEIADYLRLLYARAGTAHCTGCGQPVTSQTTDSIVERMISLPAKTKLMILSPMVRGRKGSHRDVFERIGRNGFVRARVNGSLMDIGELPELAPQREHDIDAVVDRIIIKDGIEGRIRESVALAIRESDGTCVLCTEENGRWNDRLFSTRFHCARCDLSFQTPEPRTFSFHSAYGACPECEGFGVRGVVEESADIAVFRKHPCPVCQGSRLKPFPSAVTFAGKQLAQFTALSVETAMQTVTQWLSDLSALSLSREAQLVAEQTLPDIRDRLLCLSRVGMDYLTLDRPTRTLSGGEYQRCRLAACLGTGLHGACFVLDEPTSGLHARDTTRLLDVLTRLRDQGATVVVVEHDPKVMLAADHLLDLGPGAGREGGQLMYCGPPSEITGSPTSTTGAYFRRKQAEANDCLETTSDTPTHFVQINEARKNNLQSIDVRFPLMQLVCVTGVSGSGKSSLVMDTFLPVAKAIVAQDSDQLPFLLADAECTEVTGLESVNRIISVDSSVPGKNRRSCLATYSGVWDHIRKLLSSTRGARARGYAAGRFSFNSGPGRCGLCNGAGDLDIRMTLLPNATVPCPDCQGRRFNRATLNVRFAERNAADILEMTVGEAAEFFQEVATVHRILDTFQQVGLGYLTLGQPASTFSGGEAQRIKLATELVGRESGRTLFLLDEPTSGLHPIDVEQLNSLLRRLVMNGHSVLVIEHNTQVIHRSDWVIDIGPDSGPRGGNVVYSGPTKNLLKCPDSLTASELIREAADFRDQRPASFA